MKCSQEVEEMTIKTKVVVTTDSIKGLVVYFFSLLVQYVSIVVVYKSTFQVIGLHFHSQVGSEQNLKQ